MMKRILIFILFLLIIIVSFSQNKNIDKSILNYKSSINPFIPQIFHDSNKNIYPLIDSFVDSLIVNEKFIPFTESNIVFMRLLGLIEIDGHIFNNDTCSCPIIYKADLNGIEIKDTCTYIEYKYRKCDKKDCPIIHLIIDL